MAGSRFHDKQFDEATKLKLEIFRGYIREWIPVFVSKSNYWKQVNIYDFFAGPGRDRSGNPGSPLIILDEITRYLSDETRPKAVDSQIRVFFNDADSDNIKQLWGEIDCREQDPRFSIATANLDFADAFAKELPMIRSDRSANLVILDQCGYKFIGPEVFRTLINCSTTDIIFFVSSDNIRRFAEEPSTQQYFPSAKEKITRISRNDVHRLVCNEYYQSWIPEGVKYYLVPFSIRKDNSGNIYGLIFGSRHLKGLEKFLTVCWDNDKITGEANYNIDGDWSRDGEPSLFDEYNVFRKQDQFRRDLIDFIAAEPRDNTDLRRFALQSGFLPRHVKSILQDLEASGSLTVNPVGANEKIKKGALYLRNETSRAVFHYEGT